MKPTLFTFQDGAFWSFRNSKISLNPYSHISRSSKLYDVLPHRQPLFCFSGLSCSRHQHHPLFKQRLLDFISLSAAAGARDKNLDRGFHSVLPATCLNHQLTNTGFASKHQRYPRHRNNYTDLCL